MNQIDTVKALDERIMISMLRAGFADSGSYQKGHLVTPCRVYIDRETQVLGDVGEVIGVKVSATFLIADVPNPARGDLVTVGAETWRLETKVVGKQDTSRSQWILSNG